MRVLSLQLQEEQEFRMADKEEREEPERDARGRWKTGSTGNPRGRPPGHRTLTSDLWRVLGEPLRPGELDAAFLRLEIPAAVQADILASGDRQEAFARILAARMLDGNWAAFGAVGDRLDPATTRTEIAGHDGGPLGVAGIVMAGDTPGHKAQAEYLALMAGDVDDQDPVSDDDHRPPADLPEGRALPEPATDHSGGGGGDLPAIPPAVPASASAPGTDPNRRGGNGPEDDGAGF